MNEAHPAPDAIMQVAGGAWAQGILSTGVACKVFTHVENGCQSAAELAPAAGISPRGAQAILDGLTGLGLLKLADGKYGNTPAASFYLVEGRPGYLGDYVKVMFTMAPDWQKLPEAVRTGKPAQAIDVPDNPFWHELVPAIAPLSFPTARISAERLNLAKAGAVRWLDVGGGSGVYSAVWLGTNPQARATQLDWPGVNGIAHRFVGRFGVGDRFQTIDGDFHTTDFGRVEYDFAIYSHIAHQESPATNVAVFRKIRAALKPGGTLLVADFVLKDDRGGHPFAQMFHSMMLMGTPEGAAWRESDYQGWLTEAGFKTIAIEPTPTPATLIYAS
jgi:SAM-dependent methyltransferase